MWGSKIVAVGLLSAVSGLRFPLKSASSQRFIKRDSDSLPVYSLQAGEYESIFYVEVSVGSAQIANSSNAMKAYFSLSGDSYFIGGDITEFNCETPSYLIDIESGIDSDGSSIASTATYTRDSYCTDSGFYDISESDSFSKNESAESYSLGDYYHNSTGFYAQDTILAEDQDGNSIEIKDFNFVVLDNVYVPVSKLSLGLPYSQSTYNQSSGGDPEGYIYDTLLDKMKQQGYIHKKMFGLYLSGSEDADGSVDIGAVDLNKFKGNLHNFDITDIHGYQKPISFAINIDGLSFEGNDSNRSNISKTIKASVDPSGGFTVFPSDICDKLANAIGGKVEQIHITVPCTSFDQDLGSLELQAGKLNVSVPISNFVSARQNGTCQLDIASWDHDYLSLGPSIMQYVYMVFDHEDLTVSLATVDHNTESDLVKITEDVKYEQLKQDDSSSESASLLTDGSSKTASSSSGSTETASADHSSSSSDLGVSASVPTSLMLVLSILCIF